MAKKINGLKIMSYLLAANAEAVVLIMIGYWLGNWLNEQHPIGVSWFVVTFSIAIAGVGFSFYKVVRALIQMDRG